MGKDVGAKRRLANGYTVLAPRNQLAEKTRMSDFTPNSFPE